ncbi:MAG TPA: hypothetical protein VK935_22665 [Actinomycetospora sp.]|nr:hypothetical protein [Actinomycetospora sp.]
MLVSEDLLDVLLGGHDSSGVVVTGVAQRAAERLAGLVYLDAFVPRPGQSRFAGFAASAREDGSWRGGEVVDIGHDAMVTDPEGTARVLLALVSAARAGPARRRSP